jgi:hypothetical protein
VYAPANYPTNINFSITGITFFGHKIKMGKSRNKAIVAQCWGGGYMKFLCHTSASCPEFPRTVYRLLQLDDTLIICSPITPWPSTIRYGPPRIYLEKINGRWKYNSRLSKNKIPDQIIDKMLECARFQVSQRSHSNTH